MNMLGTAGIDFKKKIITRNENNIKVTVFDTAGHERFRKINKTYYRNVKGIILVYDITDRQTFDNVTVWMNSILENTEKEKSIQLLILGNKIDIIEDRQVSADEGKNMASKYKALYAETSAKTGENVEYAFNVIIDTIIQRDQFLADNKLKESKIEPDLEKSKNEDKKNGDNYQVSKTEPDNKILITQNNENEKIKLSTDGNVEPGEKKKKKANCFCH